MNAIGYLTLGLSAALLAPAVLPAQVQWTAANSPIQTTLAGGPWTLSQGGPFSGPIAYCANGVPLVNPSSTVSTFQPFYFPFIAGRGLNLQGYFDYRPRNINEATVAANSTDGGQTWQFQQIALQLTTACPTSDTNSSGNDDGEGHPFVLSFGGASWLHLLDRRTGHVDSDGLLVHIPTPKAGQPLNGIPPVSIFENPPTTNVIAGWNFNNDKNTGGINNSPAPSTGTGTATALGMTNSYTFSTTPPTVGSVTSCDVTATSGSSDPASGNDSNAWRVRGPATNNGAGTGNGWNTAAPQETQGVEFDVSTLGYSYIVFQYDWYTTAQGIRDLQAQYTTDGSTWTNVGPIQVAPSGGGFLNQITIDFHALGITGVNNNSKFGVRLVSVYDPAYTGPGAPTYTGATLSATNQPTVYNNNSGNWRFDEVNVLGTMNGTKPETDEPVNTTGLTNPDGILAAVPNTYPVKVLYVDKTLSGDFILPIAQQCGSTPSGAAANHDLEVIRLATTPDGVHFTDLGAVNGLNDPTTVSYSGIRYVAPSGSLVKLPNNKWGLFYGGGNCLDGDSDGFHAIVYAESTDLVNWTVINSINNPIASVNTVSNVTDPASGLTVTIPANSPVIGATQFWFGGRVYNPNAMWGSSNTINLIFAGYNAGYSADLSSYRTIGHVTLSSGATVLP